MRCKHVLVQIVSNMSIRAREPIGVDKDKKEDSGSVSYARIDKLDKC